LVAVSTRTFWRGLLTRRAAVSLAGALSVLALLPATASGHAAFVDAHPEPGTRLERSPEEIELEFTEPLNRSLTEVTVVDLVSGKPVRVEAESAERKHLVLRPVTPLRKAPYRVQWRAVSTEDGHPLEGSFSFGVRTAARGGELDLEQSPLARDGWLRIALRAVLYVALLFFAGGLATTALLGRGAPPGAWLMPHAPRRELERAGRDPTLAIERHWVRTVDAGWLALGAAIAVAIAEGADASEGLSARGLSDFLLTNVAGLSRVLTVVALALALVRTSRPPLAAVAAASALLSISLSGHASSAEPRAVAVLTDWVHLVAASVWVGGLAQIAVAWVPLVRGGSPALRRSVMATVLPRFGVIALPAFVIVAATGLLNALIQLGHPSELVESGYGRVLAVKIALVGLIAAASYWHAIRLRPRLLRTNPHPDARPARRHWRLLGAEPVVGVAVLATAALLVAFPLPPSQLADGDDAEAAGDEAPCDPCPLRKPRRDELAVAENAGPYIVAAWLRRAGDGLQGELRVLGRNMKPAPNPVTITGAPARPCGEGCWSFRALRAPSQLEVQVAHDRGIYVAELPASWRPDGSRLARRLLGRAQRTMRGLRTVREREVVSSGPGSRADTRYRFEAPDRVAYVTNRNTWTVIIGRSQWFRTRGSPWQRPERYGGGGRRCACGPGSGGRPTPAPCGCWRSSGAGRGESRSSRSWTRPHRSGTASGSTLPPCGYRGPG
jgi:copper transport protein